jgi:hypothetical protein
MAYTRYLVVLTLLGSAIGFPQGTDPSLENEEAIQRTVPDKKLAAEDVPCGSYFWRSRKAGATFLYYFFGSAEWGKGKIGFYPHDLYHVLVNEDKDPPTVQRIKDAKGLVTDVRVRMTSRELAASAACLSEQ